MSLSGRMRGSTFTLGITVASRFCALRDVLSGFRRSQPRVGQPLWIHVGSRRLAACWIPPPARDAPLLLICHGIGETVHEWASVQQYLITRGVGSLVFDYSGYGQSSGTVTHTLFDQDLSAVYAEACRLAGSPAGIFVLGFSLGTGIAASAASRLQPQPAGLILCEAFTSFRDAARASGLPGFIAALLPDIWNSITALPICRLPLLVLHSDADRLFPVAMARRIAEAGSGTLVVLRGYAHDHLYRHPDDHNWGPVLDWLRQQTARPQAPGTG